MILFYFKRTKGAQRLLFTRQQRQTFVRLRSQYGVPNRALWPPFKNKVINFHYHFLLYCKSSLFTKIACSPPGFTETTIGDPR